jgi:molybdopterin/thiamine biosynthesis adenylyltransferase/rhodanese-related sulfurtransferase
MTLSSSERDRYSRHLLLPEIGAAGQERLKAARVLVVGAGGLGSPASLYLAAAGIGTLGIADCDRVELSNLQRQLLFDTAQLGASKAQAAQIRLRALNPEIDVITHDVELNADNAMEVLRQYDCVLDGSDRLTTRYLVNDACVLLKLRLVSAAIHRFEGQAMTYVPALGPCYRCLFPESVDDAVASCAEAGVLGVLPGMLGVLQATEAIKLILGIGEPLVGRLVTYDALAMEWREFRFSRREDCAVCGSNPTITSLQPGAEGCRVNSPAKVERLKPRQLRGLLEQISSRGKEYTVIDVREPREFAVGHIRGSVNIPLRDIPQRLPDISASTRLVFLCRSGGRSREACKLALQAGFEKVANLDGGMLAWAAGVDPEMTVAPFE